MRRYTFKWTKYGWFKTLVASSESEARGKLAGVVGDPDRYFLLAVW